MRPTFLGFEAAKNAIFTNQKSIDIAGNNIANSETRGYTRQRVERTAIAPSSYANRIGCNRTGLAGQGVDTLGVSQVRDSFLDKRFRDEYTKASYHGQAASILSDIQSIFDSNDITDESGLLYAINQIAGNIDDYMQDPTLDSGANLVMTAFKNMTQVLQQMDSNLTNVANQHIQDMLVTVRRTNDLLQQVAHYNKMISEDSSVLANTGSDYFKPNELMDQRNLLLDELAGYGDITVTENADGMVDVTMGGRKVVSGTQTDEISLHVNDQGTRNQTVSLNWRSTGSSVNFSGGSLKAGVEYLNGRGHNVQNNNETPVQGILYCIDKLDTFSNALVKMVNSTIPVMDPNSDPKDPQPMRDPLTGEIVYKTLLGAKMPDGSTSIDTHITAGNISISDEWNQNGPGYFIFSPDERVTQYAEVIKLRLISSSYTFDSFGEKFTGSFVDYQIDFNGKLSSDLAFNDGRQQAYGSVADDFLDRRDSVSAVNRDEETANMVQYQKSYEAAARLMTTLDDLLDIVINRMGRVGL